jgi:cytochrome c biogenesis protein CcdA
MLLADLWLLVIGAFVLGLLRGATICALVCLPAALTYALVKRVSLAESLKLGIIINIPRIALFTAAGAVVGFLVAVAGGGLDLSRYSLPFGLVGYTLIGVMFIAAGTYVLLKKGPAGCPPEEDSKSHPFVRFIEQKLSGAPRSGAGRFFLFGSLISIACMGELAIFETSALAGFASDAGDPAVSAARGAFILFIFAIGASIPVIIAFVAGSGAIGRLSSKDAVAQVRTVSAMLVVLLGMIFIAGEAFAAFSVLRGP